MTVSNWQNHKGLRAFDPLPILICARSPYGRIDPNQRSAVDRNARDFAASSTPQEER